MFQKSFYERLIEWKNLRQELEVVEDPLQHCIDFWKNAPIGKFGADPYDKNTWPDPWEMIDENFYCEFLQTLAICYTLQLTDKFSQETFEIIITQDQKKSTTYYLLCIADRIVGFRGDTHVAKTDLPKNLESQQNYIMPPLQ